MAKKQNLEPVGQFKAVTINDIAREVGTSIATVNRALRNHGRISVETKQRILDTADRLGYRPSMVAQSLAKGRSSALGVIVPMIGNTVYSPMVRSIEQTAREYGYNIILCDTDHNVELEKEYVQMLYRRRVEGLAIIPASRFETRADYSYLTDLDASGVPVVVMERSIGDLPLSQVYVDNFGDSRRIVSHLIKLGHRRIGYFHTGFDLVANERYRGYKQALIDAGIAYDESITCRVGDFMGGREIWPEEIQVYLRANHDITAIFCPMDMLATKTMAIIRSLGLRIPDDIAITGFDDILMSEYLDPPLTTVHQPATEVGRRAAEILLKRIKNPSSDQVNECISGQLMIRQSCGSKLVVDGGEAKTLLQQ